ncbi:MAG TPA: sugar transferase [Dehalococcoidia bacterium]|nr:sugar transferase [Dehalococcoidia bacterium]
MATLPQELEAHLVLEDVLDVAIDTKRLQQLCKRGIDIILGLALLALLLVPALLVALLVRIDSPGNPILTQRRVGKNGRIFRMYKFRTMVDGAHAKIGELHALNEQTGPIFKMRRDPRVTRIGRWLRKLSIDEIPQLLNVVGGDMSLVGPRPPLPHEVQAYTRGQLRRLLARPGLTGLWQVNGRSMLPFEAMVDLDVRYIEEWSLMLDLAILARTLPAIVLARGAY